MTRQQIEEIIGPSWADLMMPAFNKNDENPSVFETIMGELRKEKQAGNVIVPDSPKVFRMFKELAWPDVKVVVIGMSPYASTADPNGIAFGIDRNENYPVSLQMIFDGIEESVYNGLNLNKGLYTGDLKMWIDQGVMFYNSALTTLAGDPKAHLELWKDFTNILFTQMNRVSRNLIFIAMGDAARTAINPIIPFDHFPFTCEHPAAASYQKRKWQHNNVFINAAACYYRLYNKQLIW